MAAQRAAQQHTVQRHGQDEERQQPQDRVTLPDHGGGDERILDKGQSRHVQAGMQVEEKAEVQHVDQQGRAEKESFHPAQNRSRDGAAGSRYPSFQSGNQQAQGQGQSQKHRVAGVEFEADIQSAGDVSCLGDVGQQKI